MATYKIYDTNGNARIFETLSELRRSLGLTATEIKRVAHMRGTCRIREHEILIFAPL